MKNTAEIYNAETAEKVTQSGRETLKRMHHILSTKELSLDTIDFSDCQKLSRKEIIPMDLVFDNITYDKRINNGKVHINGDEIKMLSHRYKVFNKSTTCVNCGCVGSFFVKERHYTDKVYHLNLYAIIDGKAVLMTKDHIIPRALGGPDSLHNYQTMCTVCNSEKGCTL